MLGDVVYVNPTPQLVQSKDALQKPYDPTQISFISQFVTIPLLTNMITDTHFGAVNAGPHKRDRMGRLVVFLARMMKKPAPGFVGSPDREVLGGNAIARGLGVDAQTAVLVEANGKASVVAANAWSFAYFLIAPAKPPPANFVAVSGQPLTYKTVTVYRLGAGGQVTFQATTWAGFGRAVPYQVWADAGVLNSNQPKNNPY